MMSGGETLLAKYGWLLVGLTFGFAAKYALLIKRGEKVRALMVLADLLLLPMVGLIAYSLGARAGLVGELAALFACFCTVGADRLVKLLTDRFVLRVGDGAGAVADGLLGLAPADPKAEDAG